mmetsp:Transcript_112753/g.158175  ORF Transcript_112753/g.158175 Transcript_112753/m.158175 type:complete len:345 (-) Transcript_112753:49-1083(-)
MLLTCVASVALPALVLGHGHITIPRARNNGSIQSAGNCGNYECFWFSQIVNIPGEPTLPDYARTMNLGISSGPHDFSRTMPWRAPGTAPVLGSGCGVAGGGPKELDNGGIPPPGFEQGVDFLTIPEQEPTVYKRGSVVEMAWATFANHGGGYSWRLCPKGNVSEECFLQNTLDFVGDKQWIRYPAIQQWDKVYQIPDYEFPAVRVTEGTYPKGAMWTRNPIPACKFCDQTECMNKSAWIEQQHCSQSCSGLNVTAGICPPGTAQFPEPGSGLSGYYTQRCLFMGGGGPNDGQDYCDGLAGFNYNIVDKVQIPKDIPTGKYLLSWRWDCEQSRQIWQNCADIVIE